MPNVVDPAIWIPKSLTVMEREMYLGEIALKSRVGRFCKSFQCVCCKRGAVFGLKTHPNKHPESIRFDTYTINGTMMTVDHIIPRSWGGSTNIYNLRPMCQRCNCKRGDRVTMQEILEVKHNLHLMVEHEKWDIFIDKILSVFNSNDIELFAHAA